MEKEGEPRAPKGARATREEIGLRKAINRLVIMSLIALPVVGLAVPAGAATTTAHLAIHRTGVAATAPTSDIEDNGSSAVFKPASLKVAAYTKSKCESQSDVSAYVTNKGTATAYVSHKGSLAFSLKEGKTEQLCVYGGSAGSKLVLRLSNKNGSKTYKGKLSLVFEN